MSVINKMLRDLDARRSDGGAPDYPRPARPLAMQGTSSVLMSTGRPSARLIRWLLWLVLLLAAGAAAYWYLLDVSPPPPALPPVAAEQPAAVPVLAASAPEQAASAPMEPAGSATEARVAAEPVPAVAAEPVAVTKKKRRSEVGEPDSSSHGAAAERKEKQSRKTVTTLAAQTMPAPSSPSAVSTAPTPAVQASGSAASTAAQRRQGLARETLAQAQVLWNAGSRESALELVREASAVVERSQPADAPLLAQLVREQVRMELALGRPAAVLGLLTRLEPLLSEQADLWAVRGNAAQRLGRHQESVQAYQTALRLRPGEPRWMLGAAVSLAALGQLEAAAQQAEQARALGPVSSDVLTYLRQAGVPLR